MNITPASNEPGHEGLAARGSERTSGQGAIYACTTQNARRQMDLAVELAFAAEDARNLGVRPLLLDRAVQTLVPQECPSLPQTVLAALDDDLATVQLANARFASSGRHKQAASNHEAAAQLHREAANLCEASEPERATERSDQAVASSQTAHRSSLAAIPTDSKSKTAL